MPSLNTVTLTWDLADLVQDGQTVTVALYPSSILTWPNGTLVIAQLTHAGASDGAGSIAGIVATDNNSILPVGWTYVVTVTGGPQQSVLLGPEQIFLNFADGAVQDLSAVLQVPAVPELFQYLPIPAGSPVSGQAPIATGHGNSTVWGNVAGGGTIQPETLSAATGSFAAATVTSLVSVEFSGAGRLRLYSNSADRTTDVSRAVGALPTVSGLLYEYVADTANFDLTELDMFVGTGVTIYWQLDGGPTVTLEWFQED